jgi:MFS family permease
VRLGWISLFTDVASEMATPLIPLYLGALMAAPGLALGLIEGGAQALLALMTALAGWHSDRIRRRVPYVRWGYGLAIASKAALAVAFHWTVVLALRLADRFGKGLRGAPRDALLADLAERRRGAAFGLHRGMDTAGALVGALLAAGLLAWLPGRYRLVFALTAIPGAIAVALTFTLREPTSARGGESGPRAPLPLAAARSLPRGFWLAASVLWILALGTVSEAFVILRASEQGFADTSAVLAYAAFNAVYALSAYPAGALSDRLGRVRLLTLGWAVYALTMAVALFVQGTGVAWLFPLLGLHLGLTHGVGKAWIADLAPRALRGTAMGVFQLGSGAALLAGGVVAGLLWDLVGPSASFGWALAVGLVGLACLPLAARRA